MKLIFLILLVLACGCASKKNPEEDLLLGKEKIFLQSLQKRSTLISETYTIEDKSAFEKDGVLKGLIHYYPFADVKLVTAQMAEKKAGTSAQSIEAFMKAENDSVMEQMIKLIDAFRIIPQEQMSRTQESLNNFSLQIRRRQQDYRAPVKCFNEKDCPNSEACFEAGFCASKALK